jgi:Aspartyl protease
MVIDPKTHVTDPVDFAVGAVHDPHARFLASSYGSNQAHRRFSGIFGAPLFLSYTVTVDYGREHVTVYPPGTFDPASTGVDPTPITFVGRESYIGVCFGSTCGTFLMDTGSSMTELSKNFIARLGGLDRSGTVGRVGFDGTPHDSPAYVSPELTVGSVTFKNVTVTQGDGSERDGILGRDVLRYFAITFDWPHGRVYLVPEVPKT